MKKKIFIVLLSLCAAICTLAFAACTVNGGSGQIHGIIGKEESPDNNDDEAPKTPSQGGSEAGHVHDYGKWQVLLSPSCTVDGIEERFCKCGAAERRSLPATGHTAVKDEGWAATCISYGMTDGEHCSVCGAITKVQTKIDMLAHKEVVDAGIEPTCYLDGVTEGKHCLVCGTVTVVPAKIAKLDHEAGDDNFCDVCGVDVLIYELNDTGDGYIARGVEFNVNRKDIKKIIIPDIHCGLPVTRIGNYFSLAVRQNLESVRLPETITTIDIMAFSTCENLKEINLPDGITTINSHVFLRCLNLDNLTLPASLTKLGPGAFALCKSLSRIVIPANVEYIGTGAFVNCTSLGEIIFEGDVKEFGSGAFYNTAIESITLPDSITVIPNSLFRNCANLKYINFNNNVETIGSFAFSNCIALESITMPDSLISLGRDAFYKCSNLKTVILNENLNVIECYAFDGCTALTEITIPTSVYRIDYYAFNGCTSLNKVTFESTENWNAYDKLGVTHEFLPEELSDPVKNAGLFTETYLDYYWWTPAGGIPQIPEHHHRVGDTNFCIDCGKDILTYELNEDESGYIVVYCEVLKDIVTIVIPQTHLDLPIVGIESGAFEGYENLQSVTVGANVEYIGRLAFDGCTALESVIFENTENWSVFDINDLTKKMTAEELSDSGYLAEILTGSYKYYDWKKV